jgi:hypothetical protein
LINIWQRRQRSADDWAGYMTAISTGTNKSDSDREIIGFTGWDTVRN